MPFNALSLKRLLAASFAVALCLAGGVEAKVTRIETVSGKTKAGAAKPAASTAKAGDYTISVFYFPGWKDDAKGLVWNKPWEPIKKFPERKPTLGWYQEGDDALTGKQLDLMHKTGIDVVVYDWYWGEDNKPFLNQAIDSYLRSPNRNKVKFSIGWANHFPVPSRHDQFTEMVRYWLKHYLHHPQYQTIDGKPVVYILFMDPLRDNAKKFNATVKDLLDEAREMARADGLPGIYFIAGAHSNPYWVKHHAPEAGYDAFSVYNYHMGVDDLGKNQELFSDYASVIDVYDKQWRWMIKNSSLPLVVPVLSGWDKRPWGGSGKGKEFHDKAGGDPKLFRKHLIKAKQLMDAYPEKTRRSMVICCWNEYGEGSYIEPTAQWGTAFLDAIKSVFAQ